MKKHNPVSKSLTYLKVLLPTFMTIGLFIVALFWVVIPQFENIILDRKREMLRELTYSAESMINNWYRLEVNGKLSRVQAQASAIDQIKTLRYGEELKDYFWLTDLHANSQRTRLRIRCSDGTAGSERTSPPFTIQNRRPVLLDPPSMARAASSGDWESHGTGPPRLW